MFTNRNGGHLAQGTWAGWHERLCARLGIARPTLHELRHTAATLMLENNVHVKVVSDILGHHRIETTLNTYQHVSADLQRSASDALDTLLDATTSPETKAKNG